MTSKDYLDPNGEPGKFKASVYNKETDHRGEEVVGEKIGKIPTGKDNRRTIWWCPASQF